MMDRHPTDFAELLFGLVFLATGAGFIVHQLSNQAFDAAWVAAVALVAVGSAFLAATLLHRPDRSPRPVAEPTLLVETAESGEHGDTELA